MGGGNGNTNGGTYEDKKTNSTTYPQKDKAAGGKDNKASDDTAAYKDVDSDAQTYEPAAIEND